MAGEADPVAPRDLLILSVLSHGSQHGYGIVREVEDRTDSGVRLDPANLYRALRRMRRDGWIQEADEGEGEGRRRTFALTREGEAVLRAEIARLERLLRNIHPAIAGTGGRR